MPPYSRAISALSAAKDRLLDYSHRLPVNPKLPGEFARRLLHAFRRLPCHRLLLNGLCLLILSPIIMSASHPSPSTCLDGVYSPSGYLPSSRDAKGASSCRITFYWNTADQSCQMTFGTETNKNMNETGCEIEGVIAHCLCNTTDCNGDIGQFHQFLRVSANRSVTGGEPEFTSCILKTTKEHRVCGAWRERSQLVSRVLRPNNEYCMFKMSTKNGHMQLLELGTEKRDEGAPEDRGLGCLVSEEVIGCTCVYHMCNIININGDNALLYDIPTESLMEGSKKSHLILKIIQSMNEQFSRCGSANQHALIVDPDRKMSCIKQFEGRNGKCNEKRSFIPKSEIVSEACSYTEEKATCPCVEEQCNLSLEQLSGGMAVGPALAPCVRKPSKYITSTSSSPKTTTSPTTSSPTATTTPNTKAESGSSTPSGTKPGSQDQPTGDGQENGTTTERTSTVPTSPSFQQPICEKCSSLVGWLIGSLVSNGLLLVTILALIITIFKMKKGRGGKQERAKPSQNVTPSPTAIKVENPAVIKASPTVQLRTSATKPAVTKAATTLPHPAVNTQEGDQLDTAADTTTTTDLDTTGSGSDSTGTEGHSEARITVGGFAKN